MIELVKDKYYTKCIRSAPYPLLEKITTYDSKSNENISYYKTLVKAPSDIVNTLELCIREMKKSKMKKKEIKELENKLAILREQNKQIKELIFN